MACARRARTPGPRSNGTRWRSTACSPPFIPAGFYYKTFMQPKGAWAALYEPIDPPRRRARRGAARGRSRSLRLRIRPLRRRGGRRRPGRPWRRLWRRAAPARASCCSTSRPNSAARCSPKRRRAIDGVRPPDWLAATLAELAAAPRVTLLPRTQMFGYYAQNFLAGLRAADRPSRRARSAPAARAAVAGARQARRAGDRRARAPAGFSRQRPARHHARRSGARARPRAMASSRARASSSRPRMIRPIAPRSISPPPASRSR